MNIKILGGGCPKCIILYNNVQSACRELEIEATIEKVQDFEEISLYGVLSTPALVINEKVVGTGNLNYRTVKQIIENV
ncbi:MAG: thioredoxin family protein [Bacilli bacterium]|nr:thioredoxin family protein [Bacilli bacterium]